MPPTRVYVGAEDGIRTRDPHLGISIVIDIRQDPDQRLCRSDFDDPWRALAWAMKMVVLPLSAAASWCCELEGQIGVGGL